MQAIKEETYKVYVTDSLRLMVNNVARFAGGHTIEQRYVNIINPVPERSPAEVIEDAIKRSKVKVI